MYPCWVFWLSRKVSFPLPLLAQRRFRSLARPVAKTANLPRRVSSGEQPPRLCDNARVVNQPVFRLYPLYATAAQRVGIESTRPASGRSGLIRPSSRGLFSDRSWAQRTITILRTAANCRISILQR